MDARRYVIPLLFAGLVLTLVGSAGAVLARGPTAPPTRPASQDTLGSAFTYQGRLMEGGNPANGLYDFQFGLFDSTDAAVGSLVELGNVSVTDGLFTVQLDFGAVFDGRKLWLQIGVKPGGSADPYTAFAERQELTAAPYALYALDLGCPGCVNSTDIENGTILLADIGPNGCLPGQLTKWNGAGWSCSNLYARTVIVSPVGSDAQNGNALLAALAGITGASSSSPWLLKIEPGRYDLGTQALKMQQWVDIEGSGEFVTTITALGSTSSGSGTVLGANNAELRFLTVENSGGSTHATAIYNGETSPRLTYLTAKASGGSYINTGVVNYAVNPASPTMANVTAIGSGGTRARGIENAGSAPTMKDVTATGQDATVDNYGIYNDAMASFVMTNVTAIAQGGPIARAIRNSNFSIATMSGVTAMASGGTSENTAVYNNGAKAILRYVTATAEGAASRGLLNLNSTVTVDLSSVDGGTSSIENVGISNVVRVGASQLAGGPVTGSGFTCAGVYDEIYTLLSSTCL